MDPETTTVEPEGPATEETVAYASARNVPGDVILGIVAEKLMTAALLLRDLDREADGGITLAIPEILKPLAPEGAALMGASGAAELFSDFAEGIMVALMAEDGEGTGDAGTD